MLSHILVVSFEFSIAIIRWWDCKVIVWVECMIPKKMTSMIEDELNELYEKLIYWTDFILTDLFTSINKYLRYNPFLTKPTIGISTKLIL